MNDVILEFKNFGFKYNAQQNPTLFDINLKVHRGEKILIVGSSGCGKSTLANCINGLIPFSYKGTKTGNLTIFGKETQDMSIFDISKKVGTVLQDPDGQFIGLTVAEDIAFALENDCTKEPTLHQRVKEVAEIVSIGTHLKHSPNDISGGQKQRVSLAGVMVSDVDILLFDEPLANLDPETGKKTIELIDKIQKETGVSVIIIEHRLEDALYCDVDRIVIMNEGRIEADGTPDEVLSGDKLQKYGIREPLYITALKYAGVEITPDKAPHSINTLKLTDEEKSKVKEWLKTVNKEPQKARNDTLLRVSNIDFSYIDERTGVGIYKALSDVSVDIKKGEMLAIVGKNGAGKSTFSKVLCGFEREQSGDLIFDGMDLRELSIKERADHIGYVMQNPNQMISKTMIFDEVALGLKTRNVPDDEITERVNEVLKICGLWAFRNWPISALSFGQKKRVTIASILVMNPEMIILDEPTAGQDYRHYTDIMEFLLELNQKGITIVIITHDMHLMLEYAERAIVFADKKVITSSMPSEILTNPDIIKKASLKDTSLYELAIKCGIDDAKSFVQSFIDYERKVMR